MIYILQNIQKIFASNKLGFTFGILLNVIKKKGIEEKIEQLEDFIFLKLSDIEVGIMTVSHR